MHPNEQHLRPTPIIDSDHESVPSIWTAISIWTISISGGNTMMCPWMRCWRFSQIRMAVFPLRWGTPDSMTMSTGNRLPANAVWNCSLALDDTD